MPGTSGRGLPRFRHLASCRGTAHIGRAFGSPGPARSMTVRTTTRWIPWLLGASALAAVVLVVAHVAEERAFVTLLQQARPWWLLWAMGLQAMTYVAQAEVWRIVLHRAGAQLPFGIAYRLSLAKLFVDQALPSVGLSGTVVVTQALEARGHPRPVVMSAVAVDTASYFAGYVLSLAVALAIVIGQGHASSLIVAVAALFFVFGTSLTVAVLSLSGRVPGHWAAHLLKVPGIGRALNLLQQAEPRLARNPAVLSRATALQITIAVLDAATMWVLIRALGTSASPGAVFASFMISSLLRTFGFMPGGLGTFEAASVATLALAGIPVPVGLSATLLFRGLSFWLPMLPGLAFSRRLAAIPGAATTQENLPQYWTMSPADVAAQLHAPAEGLSSAEAERRLAETGPNEISERERFTQIRRAVEPDAQPAAAVAAVRRGAVGRHRRVDRRGHHPRHRPRQRRHRLHPRIPRAVGCGRAASARAGARERASGRQAASGADHRSRSRRRGHAFGRQHRPCGRGAARRRRLLRQRISTDRRELSGPQAPWTGGTRRPTGPALQLPVPRHQRAQRQRALHRRTHRQDHRVRCDRPPPDASAARDRIRSRHPPLRLPAHERDDRHGPDRARGQPAARPPPGRDPAVLHRTCCGPEPRTAAGNPQHQPRARRQRHGRAWRAGATAERYREPGQHGRAVHGQDGHAHRGRGEAARVVGTRRRALVQRAGACLNQRLAAVRPGQPARRGDRRGTSNCGWRRREGGRGSV